MTASLKSLAMLLAYLLICQPLLPPVASAQLPADVEELRAVHPWEPMPQPAPEELQPPGPAAPIPLSSTTWTPIGPAPLATTAPPNSNSNVSGRLTGIAAHPTNANVLYVAAAGGGVWKTTDGGATWTPLTDGQSTLSMGAIAIAPSNSSVIYAGTGEANNSADSNYGRGILTSTDGGATWTLRTAAGAFDRRTTAKIVVDPTNATVAYAAIAGFGANGIFGSNTGIWKTTNGGVTWTNTTTAITSAVDWSDVAIDPTTPTTLYAAVGYIFGDSHNGVYKSTNGGTNWSLLAGAPSGTTAGRIAIAVAPSNSQVVYASASVSGSPFGALSKIMRSDNGGTSWTDLTAGTPNYMGGQGWYDTTLIVDPTNSAIVYAAGAAGTNSMLRSTNSGVSWTDIHIGGAPTNSSPHVDHHAAAFDASGRLLDGNDGGIWRLDNPTTPSWTNLNGNLTTIQFQGVGLHPTNANIAVGGSQDNGTEVFGGSVLWTETDGGDGGLAKFSPTNGARAYHQIPNASFGTNFFRRSDDTGQTWTTKTSSISVDVNSQNFYAPFAVDPGNGNRVLYGTNRVWETTNGGDTWAVISNVNVGGFNSGGNFVDAIGLAPSDTNTVYAATGGTFAANSQIFVTTNHGAAWTERDLPVGGRVNDIQVDRANAQVAYAVINRFNATNGQVYKTVNGGAAWTNITGNLPAIPVWSLQIDSTTNRLFVGADDGVYVTGNGGATWSRFGTGLPNVQVFQIELNAALNILTAATHGRSAWQMSTSGVGFGPPTFTLAAFGYGAGGWTSNDTYPRVLADVNGDGRADIVGFGSSGVYVSLATGGGNFAPPMFVLGAFGYSAGGWTSNDTYPRVLADVNGDGRADIVGFGSNGVYVSLATGGGNFAPPMFVLGAFGYSAGGWFSNDTYPRMLADVNGDGMADIVGFGYNGVYVSLATGGGNFAPPVFVLGAFGYGAGSWVSNDTYPRVLADVNGDGMADIVGFGYSGVYVSVATGGGNFAPPVFVLAAFGYGAGGWTSNDTYPRVLADVNGDGKADIVGFGYNGVYLSPITAGGNFAPPMFVLGAFGYGAGGWFSNNIYPRRLGDVNGDGKADIVGFGYSGVYESLSGP
jgi:FG-GAP-like repeat